MLRCQGTPTCLDFIHQCDGVEQCPLGDDEWFCDATCPAQCTCNTLSYWCRDSNLTLVPAEIQNTARLLDLSHNHIGLMNTTFEQFVMLSSLNLAENGISELGIGLFSALVNLLTLDLTFNRIQILQEGCFDGLNALVSLYLVGNPILEVRPGALNDLVSVGSLSLAGLDLTVLHSMTFQGLESLRILDLSENALHTLENDAFNGLSQLQQLDIQDNQIVTFVKEDFTHLEGLGYLWSDDYMFCCFVDIPEENCQPEKDAISSCSDLMSNNVLRVFLWMLGLMSLIGKSHCNILHICVDDKFTLS